MYVNISTQEVASSSIINNESLISVEQRRILWKNLAEGADNPPVDLVSIRVVFERKISVVITFRQVGVVKSTEAVVRTSTSAFWADIDVKHVECHLTLASLK